MNKYFKPEISVLGLTADERFAEVCTKEPLRNGFIMEGAEWPKEGLNLPTFPFADLPPHPGPFNTRDEETVTCYWYISPIS